MQYTMIGINFLTLFPIPPLRALEWKHSIFPFSKQCSRCEHISPASQWHNLPRRIVERIARHRCSVGCLLAIVGTVLPAPFVRMAVPQVSKEVCSIPSFGWDAFPTQAAHRQVSFGGHKCTISAGLQSETLPHDT